MGVPNYLSLLDDVRPINYMYKELIFTNINENNNNEYYYICPCRSSLEYNQHNLQFLTKNLNNAERDKINDRIKIIKVVTEESSMNMISTFLVQISKTSSLSGTNALIDSIVQNKANRIFIILNSEVIESDEILYYEDVIKSITESGYVRKLKLFVNFKYNGQHQHDKEELEESKMKLLDEVNDRLYNLFKNKECFDIVKGLKYSSICIPSDVRLIEHLLGVQENKLEKFSNYLTHLNGSIEDVVNTENATVTDGRLHGSTNVIGNCGKKDEGIAQMNEILNNINSLKINYSINRLENDLKSLTNINNRCDYYKEAQNSTIIFLVVATLVLHTVTSAFFNGLLLKLKVNNFNVPEVLKKLVTRCKFRLLIRKYLVKLRSWVLFYVFLIGFYLIFDFVSNKFLLKREFDKNKYQQQKSYSKHLNDLKNKLSSTCINMSVFTRVGMVLKGNKIVETQHNNKFKTKLQISL
ncbi:conserved hypothetical protein [Theileria orientalis strain Shintoku]|uniref:Uncharacterized protein n=1 Tax=Theileria orientalis strain Shintoku TaxID=869250 RepID=J4CCH2_THEOR|nr:conserved hypothetical protein [Theileria orientalis strain Shintoku]BAM39387.1 conserved hypothetical protein [Theileria orientalis strain Shintoku]|eukprot:XP_009689688.1 conserved hypothetical protein [Theileria orientalis strain Shintoku]